MTMWKNSVQPVRPQMKISAHAHCMLDTQSYTHTHTHSEYVLFIEFPLQQRLHEWASALRDSLVMKYERRTVHAFRMHLQKWAIRTRSLATGKWHVILHLQRKAVNDTTNTHLFECNNTEVFTDLNTTALKLHCR